MGSFARFFARRECIVMFFNGGAGAAVITGSGPEEKGLRRRLPWKALRQCSAALERFICLMVMGEDIKWIYIWRSRDRRKWRGGYMFKLRRILV